MDALLATSTIHISGSVKIGVALAIIFVVLLIYSYGRALGDADAGLYGLWEIDGDFADQVGIDTFYMFISPPGGKAARTIGFTGATCQGYVMLKTIDSPQPPAFNGKVSLALRRTSMRADAIHTYSISFAEIIPGLPKKATLQYDSVTGMLIMMHQKMMYARLFKKTEASYYCAQADESSPTQEDSREAPPEPPEEVESSETVPT